MASYVLRQAKQQYPEQLLELGICPFDIISVFCETTKTILKCIILGCGCGVSTGRVCCQLGDLVKFVIPRSYSTSVDLWSLGCVLAEMALLRPLVTCILAFIYPNFYIYF